MTAPACFGAPSRPSDTPMPTMITESTALPKVRQARHPAGMEPNSGGGINSVAAGQALQNDLARASHQTGAQQHKNVPPGTSMLGRVQQVGAGTAPHEVLHHFQQPGQYRRAYARTDTCEQHRHPKAARAGTSQRGRDGVTVGWRHLRWKSVHSHYAFIRTRVLMLRRCRPSGYPPNYPSSPW